MSKIDLLKSKQNIISIRSFWQYKLSPNATFLFKRVFYSVSWIAIILTFFLLILRFFFSNQISWLHEMDIIPFLFILVDMIILNRVTCNKGINNEKFWFWFLISLFCINFIWSLGAVDFKKEEIYNFSIGLNYLLIFAGLILLDITRLRLFLSLKEISKELDRDITKEIVAENKRYKNFTRKFRNISQLPIFSNIIEKVAKGGWLSMGLVVLLLATFFIIKIPYFNNSVYETPNFDKFKTYLPNLINAYDEKNIFSNENGYYQVLNSDQGKTRAYSDFPFYTWFFYPFMPLSEKISFIVLVRILMAFLDMLIVLGIYLIFNRIFTRKIALIGLLLLIVNSFFHNYFFVTVLDRPALLFLVLAIVSYLYNAKPRAYLLSGLAILSKISFAPIALPFFVLKILLEKNTKKEKSIEILNFITLSFLPIAIFSILLKKVPYYSQLPALLSVVFGLLIILFVYYLVKKEIFKEIINAKKIFFGVFVFLFSGISLFVLYSNILRFRNSFLSSFDLLFKWKIYYMIFAQQDYFFPPIALILALAGLLLGVYFFSKERKIVVMLLTCSAIFYLLVGAKVIFFHLYYRHILVIVEILLICCFLSVLQYLTKNRFLNNALILFIVLSLALGSYGIYKDRAEKVSRSDSITNYTPAVDYLKSIVGVDEKILTKEYKLYGSLPLLSHRSPALFSASIANEVKESGFCETMKKYNVKYYISEGESDFRNIYYFFQYPTTKKIDRTELILYRISDEIRKKHGNNELVDVRDEFNPEEMILQTEEMIESVYNKIKPHQFFELINTVDDLYVYRLKDCDKTSL